MKPQTAGRIGLAAALVGAIAAFISAAPGSAEEGSAIPAPTVDAAPGGGRTLTA